MDCYVKVSAVKLFLCGSTVLEAQSYRLFVGHRVNFSQLFQIGLIFAHLQLNTTGNRLCIGNGIRGFLYQERSIIPYLIKNR